MREVDVLTVKGKEKDIVIMELVWQDRRRADDADDAPEAARRRGSSSRTATRAMELGEGHMAVAIGRDAQNDVVIADRLASRMHARIERRRDKFVLVDQSSNGTFVTVDGEGEIQLRREELMLRGRGRISFGHSYAGRSGRDARLRVHRGREHASSDA